MLAAVSESSQSHSQSQSKLQSSTVASASAASSVPASPVRHSVADVQPLTEGTDVAVALAVPTVVKVEVKTKPAVVKRAVFEEDVPVGKVVPADSFDSMVVGKSSSGNNMNSAYMYGSERLDGPYNTLLDLLNSYVGHLYFPFLSHN